MNFQQISLARLSALSAFAICFAVIFGVGAWLKPHSQEAPLSMNMAVAISTPSAEPLIDENAPDPSRLVADMMAVPQFIAAANPDHAAAGASAAPPQATFVGVWAPDATSCSLQNFKDGLLPTVINNEGASAGDTFCNFKNQQRTPAGWRVDAHCSNKQEQWSTRVHLSATADRLLWKSKRGTQAYTRCTNDLRMAEAQ